jgi:hypothetical protein
MALHPRKPAPRDLRHVCCPHCEHKFEVSRRAISLRCPRCTQPLRFEDLVIRHRVKGDLTTMGQVNLAAASEMIGRLACGQLSSGGRFEGELSVFGDVELMPQSVTTGTVTARSLRVSQGAVVRIKADIRPKPPAPAELKPVVVKRAPKPQFAI